MSDPDPIITEYPKMLYLGPTRTQVTVQTAEEEATQRAAYGEQADKAAPKADRPAHMTTTQPKPAAEKPPAAKPADTPKKKGAR